MFLQLSRDELHNAPAFGPTAIEGLLTTEQMLQDALRYVPYCDEHYGVWSSHFASIILEAASHVDSIWKATANLEDPSTVGERLNIVNHFNRFGSVVANQWVVFFGGASPCVIAPFECWKAGYSEPTWWGAYNALKHDRLKNQEQGNLKQAVEAVAALILAVVYCGKCDVALVSRNLLDTSSGRNYKAFTESGLIRDTTAEPQTLIDTELFAHPLGMPNATRRTTIIGMWLGANSRFAVWWTLNAERILQQ